jgi:hypothetical protein
MFKDEHRDKVWNEIRQLDLKSFRHQLTPEIFSAAATRANVSIGRNPLNWVNMVWLGIASAMQRTVNFAGILISTLKLLEDDEQFSSSPLGKEKQKAQHKSPQKSGNKRSKHDPRGQEPMQVREEAFAQARQMMPLTFWIALLTLLAERFQQAHDDHLRSHGFRLLVIDGTTLTLANDERLRTHFGTPKNGQRKRACPQARMVMLTLPGTRIPIAYELAPLVHSELELSRRLMNQVRSQDLLLMDRGFISYGLFWQIQQQGAYFGTRLKKGLHYKKCKQLGPKDELVEWIPKDSRRKWKQQKLPRLMQLRVIHYQIKGFRASAIITNVLDPKRISREDWVRVAIDCEDKGKLKPGLYHRRWEIETTYSELKVTLGLKSLRSRTPASLQYEVAGCVVYYLLVRWLIVEAAEKHSLDPLRISFTEAIRELEQMRRSLLTSSLNWAAHVLLPRLLNRIASHTVSIRPGRHYPRPNDTKAKDKGYGQKQSASKLCKRINSNHRNKKQTKAARQA